MLTLSLKKYNTQFLFYQKKVFEVNNHLKKFLSAFFYMKAYPAYLKKLKS